MNVVVALLAFGFGAVCLYAAVKQQRKTSLVENTPTETAGAVSMGRSELEGTATPEDGVIPQPFTDGDAVFVWFRMEQTQRKPLLGAAKTTTRQQKWVVLDEGEAMVPMSVTDGTGKVYIDLSQSPEFHISNANRTKTMVRTWQDENDATTEFLKQYKNITPTRSGIRGVLDGVKRRYTQVVLPADETMYVFGSSHIKKNGAKVIGRDEETGEFMISDEPTDELQQTFKTEVLALAGTGAVLFAAEFYALLFGVPIGLGTGLF